MLRSLFFKLVGAFALIILVLAVVATLLANRATTGQFRLYSDRNGQLWAQRLAPTLAWWLDVALGRDPEAGLARRQFAAAARAQEARVRARIAPGGRYRVRGRAGTAGNPTLRADLALIGQLARGLGRRADRAAIAADVRAELAARWLALLDGYRADLAARWVLSAPTEAAFTAARSAIARALGAPGAAPV